MLSFRTHLSRFEEVQRYFGILSGCWGLCGKNRVTERRRLWEMLRMQWDGGNIMWYNKEVVQGVATSDDVGWFHWSGVTGWCVILWDESWMVHRTMSNGSRVPDEVYIKGVLLGRDGFLFFAHYSLSCIAKQVMTLKQLQILSCLDFLDTNFACPLSCFCYHVAVTNITYAQPRPLQQ
jgi:hypothetical protein